MGGDGWGWVGGEGLLVRVGGSIMGKIANRQVLVDTMGQAKLADFGCAKVWCTHPARALGHSIADIDAHRMSSYTLALRFFSLC